MPRAQPILPMIIRREKGEGIFTPNTNKSPNANGNVTLEEDVKVGFHVTKKDKKSPGFRYHETRGSNDEALVLYATEWRNKLKAAYPGDGGERMRERGRRSDAEAEFAKLLGGLHVKSSMAELSKTDRGDEVDGVKFSELFMDVILEWFSLGSFVAMSLLDIEVEQMPMYMRSLNVDMYVTSEVGKYQWQLGIRSHKLSQQDAITKRMAAIEEIMPVTGEGNIKDRYYGYVSSSPFHILPFICDLEAFYVDLWMKCEKESILDLLLLWRPTKHTNFVDFQDTKEQHQRGATNGISSMTLRSTCKAISLEYRKALITDIKSALTQRALQIFCETYHIPDEVNPQLPNPNQTIHEMPTGKIGVYTRFFEYANFRLPLSTFLVDVLRYYHIHISQLSVIGAAKVSHFEVLCRVHGFEPTVGLFRCFYVNSKNKGWMSFSKRPGNDAVCYTKPLDSLKNWNDRFFWVDSFACPASFPWSTSKGVPKDPFHKSFKFNAEHYAILVAHPAPFHKYLEPFLCLVGISRYYTLDVDTYPEFLRDGEMDLLSFIRTADPMKVRVGERQRANDEHRLLETTVDQGDSADGGQGVDIQPVIAAADTIVEDVAPLQLMHRKKRKTVAMFLAGAVLNAEVKGEPILTLPFVTSSVSATPERENENPADSVTGPDLRTISAPQRFVISSDSSHHFSANIMEAKVDSIVRSSTLIIATVATTTVDAAATAKETSVKPSLFGAGSSSAGWTDPTPGGFSDASGSDFLIGGIRTVVEPDFD
ncbi:hypothetical protein Tco_0161720, partial [Tanacetum coccineum]